MDLYGLVGAGGFGREVMPVAAHMLEALQTRTFELVFVVEEQKSQTSANGHRVIGKEEFLSHRGGERFFNIAIADAINRRRIASELLQQSCRPFQIAADNVKILAENNIGEGAILSPFVTITSNARIGRFFHANIYSYVAHDCVVGDFVTFAPNVACNGGVIVEDFAYLGTGAIVRQGSATKPITIGKGSIVGMGAVVTKDVAPYSTVIGNPARPLLPKTELEG